MSERRKAGNTIRKRKDVAVGKTDRDKMKGIVHIIYVVGIKRKKDYSDEI